MSDEIPKLLLALATPPSWVGPTLTTPPKRVLPAAMKAAQKSSPAGCPAVAGGGSDPLEPGAARALPPAEPRASGTRQAPATTFIIPKCLEEENCWLGKKACKDPLWPGNGVSTQEGACRAQHKTLGEVAEKPPGAQWPNSHGMRF
ncbi:hypothetical protein HispidOSU_004257 [Sigmodon hispidus]